MKPLLSILCITYNHEKYISQTLDSLLSQKTNFPIEILIHDDASTDKTAEIIREYTSKHPDVFRPTFEKQNQYSLGKDGFIGQMYVDAKGDYIAICEGDDYWTDPTKLQRQVNFLEKNKAYALCFHPVKVIYQNDPKRDAIFPSEKSNFTINKLLKANFIQTNSVVYRKQKYQNLPTNILPSDWYMHLYHARFGKIGFINRVMSVYRRHPGGVFWEASVNIDQIWKKHGIAHLALYFETLKLFGKNKEYSKIIQENINAMMDNLIRVDVDGKLGLLEAAITKYPKGAAPFITEQYKKLSKNDEVLQRKENEINQAKDELRKKEQELEQTKVQLQNIKASKVWRARNKAAKLVGRQPV